MTKLDKVFYAGRAHTSGGRDGYASRTDDGRLDVALAVPGRPGTGANTERLFAVGWSACFLSAIKIAASKARFSLPANASVDAEVDLGLANDIHGLAARLNVNVPRVDRPVAESLAETAHHLWPYSNATRRNVEVTVNVITGYTAQPMEAAQYA
jgi:Ohr subfamily peroxiredoxin